jgi:N-acyl homoserine lactone hydrolase
MSRYSIWVLEYADCPECPVSGLMWGAHNQGTVRMPYGYVVIKGGGHIIMVDVGFNYQGCGETLVRRYHVGPWHSPTEVLAEIGLGPEDVDTILITHAHFDHMGNLEEFPNAKVFVQEREISKSLWAFTLPPEMAFLTVCLDPGDLMNCVQLAREGRLRMVDGDRTDLLPGIDLRVAYDTHSPASMWVVVRNDEKSESADTWVLAGDLVYVYENISGDGAVAGVEKMYRPIAFAVGSQTSLIFATDAMMKAVGRDQRRVIPVHERRLAEEFPSRVTKDGIRVSEICLANGERSKVH